MNATSGASEHGGVILFSAQDYWYHNRAHSDVQLARSLSKDRPVLLVNSLGMRMPTPSTTTQPVRRVMRKVRSTFRALRRPEEQYPGLWVFSPVSVPVFGKPRLSSWNARSVQAQVAFAARRAGVGRPDVVITLPTAWAAAQQVPARSVVVNRSDKYSSLPEADTAMVEGMEREMLAACDAAVYVSEELLADERSLLGGDREPVLLGHGVDLAHFDPDVTRPVPVDLAGVPGPRIGFFGGIDDYVVDLDLLKRVAVEIPEAHLVLVGAATCDMDELTVLPNVHWLGMKSYDEVPDYGALFDVALMPWVQNDWIRFCNPIKTKEYLALGLPVVTTAYPEAGVHRDVMAIAHSGDEFVAMVREALDGRGAGTVRSRRAAVAGDSWDARADVLRRLFEGSTEVVPPTPVDTEV